MKVTDLIPSEGVTEDELLGIAFALESKSEHPISKAIAEYGTSKEAGLKETSEFEVSSGNGIKAKVGEKVCYAGNLKYIESVSGKAGNDIKKKLDALSAEGKTPVLIAEGNRILGIIAVSDVIKEDSPESVAELKKMGIHVVMLTGDNKITAKAIAEKVGVDEVVASVKPGGKEAVIRKLMEYGNVTMVGDGINDAPALTAANLGIAIGAGTDIAIDAADVVLMKNRISDVAAAIRISRRTLRNIHENLFWAFFYNILGIPLAAGCYVAFGITLNPVFGAAAMGLSSFCVVSNALRLNLIKPYDTSKDKMIKNPVTGKLIEDDTNETVEDTRKDNEMKINVNGMMCGHCEAHVKKALEAIDGIESAAPSHADNCVTLTTSKDVDEAVIKAAIEDAGYEYAGIAE